MDMNNAYAYPPHERNASGNDSTKNYIGYEYKELTVNHSMESFYVDGYANFGWQLDDISGMRPGMNTVSIKFKRDRKILNKAELTRLQRQFDACTNEIAALERSKTGNATMAALVIGLVGCGFLALSVFAITAAVPNIFLCVLFGLPGIVCWVLPYFVYQKMHRKRIQTVEPLIDAKYDEIYEVCEKANTLLPK